MRTIEQIRREIDSLKFRLCTDFDASGRAMANRLEVVEAELATAIAGTAQTCATCGASEHFYADGLVAQCPMYAGLS